MSISVLILTKNEETNIAACLDSVAWSDDVVVFDSFSTDATVDMARSKGAKVVQHRFESYGKQREAARTMVRYRHPWVFALDADEQPDAALISEMQAAAASGERKFCAFRMRRKDFMFGKWIKRSSLYPSWFIRFYLHDRIKYEPRCVHEYPTVEGACGSFDGHIIHNTFSKGFSEWIDRHNRYSSLEAVELLRETVSAKIKISSIFASDPVRRRRALKALSYRLPMRPLLRFLYMYLLRMGFLDGHVGYQYCKLISEYQRLIDLKVLERLRTK